MRRSVALAALVLGGTAFAQQIDPFRPAASGVEESLARWRAAHGETWRADIDRESGYARFIYGGRAEASFAPNKDEDYFVLAREALQQTVQIHGVDADTLEEDQVMFLPLGTIGTTDKVTVQFRQRVRGVPVEHGFVNALFDTRGRLLTIDVTGLPHLTGEGTEPSIDAVAANEVALEQFERDTHMPVTRRVAPELVLDQHREAGARSARLAWRIELHTEVPDVQNEGFAYFVDARSGVILRRENCVHQLDVSGTVRSLASPGTLPDTAANPETNQPMANLHVVYNTVNNVTTDANGNFNVPGAFFPLFVTVLYQGPYCNTVNAAGSDYALSQNLTMASGNQINMNPGAAAQTTAEANAFKWVNALRNWIVAVNSFDVTPNFQAQANVNVAMSCNANFSGTAVNFYSAGGSCANFAYSSVVAHEMGHWLNMLYGSGNGPDGFGEGNADVFAMYLLDDPIIGQDKSGPGTFIRTGNNTRQFCGDTNPGCAGEVHDDGEVLMGALWKVRARLKTTNGGPGGGAIANMLFNGWMTAYNDFEIKTSIESHWLALDDNDGNPSNGTVHFADIDGGFRDQGFPGPTVYVDLANTTPPQNGSLADPYNDVSIALPNVAPDGQLIIFGAVYDESPLTINQRVTLRSGGGIAVVQ